ncbi:MAG: hypothetical protein QG661_947, partial [Actinomycetota bacterium]|nr:hypothetical protein [Actinomycetota bacterium]
AVARDGTDMVKGRVLSRRDVQPIAVMESWAMRFR